jgi:hypothetical protein
MYEFKQPNMALRNQSLLRQLRKCCRDSNEVVLCPRCVTSPSQLGSSYQSLRESKNSPNCCVRSVHCEDEKRLGIFSGM